MPPSWLTLLIVLIQLLPACLCVTLDTRLGQIEGKEVKTKATGRTYFSFTGVPYAKLPLGELRLKNPVEHGSWSGKLDATKYPEQCLQVRLFVASLRNETIGQEDCLYLNIYTPTTDVKKNLPVLVYIHGGGFRCGSPGPEEGVTNFMEEDVVIVTFQYRLGTLGFLSTEDTQIPGNFGLKDQAMALKWLSENIDQYGGDPELITVFGESAGGASVHYQITSPLSRHYLKGGIAQSGVVDAFWALSSPGRARVNAKRLSRIIGCEMNENFLECLQGIDAKELILAEEKFLFWDFDPVIVFQPVIEAPNEGAFLVEDPRKIKVKKSLMTGFVSGEGYIKSSALLNQDDSVTEEFINNFKKYLPGILYIDPTAPKLSEFVSLVKDRFFRDLNDRQQLLSGLEEIYKEAFFVYPLINALKRHRGPKYAYLFNHRAENSWVEIGDYKKMDTNKPSHGDDILNLFDFDSVFPDAKGCDVDKKVTKKLVKYWVNFAKHQNPTPEGSDVTWSQYKKYKFLTISTEEDKFENLERLEEIENFWTKAYSLLETINKDEL